MKLHLGCGEQYLKGYVNIDYPPSEHSVQTNNVADRFADLLTLRYPAGSIDEIRLHHVFEHFSRPIASALVASWYSWLKPNGRLHIEVPDFQRTARILLNRFAPRGRRAMAERHIFGSHEAHWAVHYAGYMPDTLSYFMNQYGFKVRRIKKYHFRSIHNMSVIAEKRATIAGTEQFRVITEAFLKDRTVDDTPNEKRQLAVWMTAYDNQIAVSWASEAERSYGILRKRKLWFIR